MHQPWRPYASTRQEVPIHINILNDVGNATCREFLMTLSEIRTILFVTLIYIIFQGNVCVFIRGQWSPPTACVDFVIMILNIPGNVFPELQNAIIAMHILTDNHNYYYEHSDSCFNLMLVICYNQSCSVRMFVMIFIHTHCCLTFF